VYARIEVSVMKGLVITLSVLAVFVLAPVLANAETDQPVATGAPLSQPLIREGALAIKLADALNVGTPMNETEAESKLSAIGVAPRNGWIGDYPVTPDIIGELQTSVTEAVQSGRLKMQEDAALKTFQDVIGGHDLPVTGGNAGTGTIETSAPAYPDTTDIDNYYYNEGPPVVTYYAPPPDYGYLYSWVPYPFWWSNFWFPGFFVLSDFDIYVHGNGHFHGHGYLISNHFRDHNSGRMSRIDPANRIHGGTFADNGGTRWFSRSAQRGAAAIFNRSNNVTVSGSHGAFVLSRGASSISSSTGRSIASSRRIYGNASSYGGRGFSQPAYRASGNFSPAVSSGWSRSYNATSIGGARGFSGGSRGFGGGRGSFGGGRR